MAARAFGDLLLLFQLVQALLQIVHARRESARLVGLALAVGLDLIHLLLQIGDLLVEIVDLGLELGVVLAQGILLLEGLGELCLFRLERARGDTGGAENRAGQHKTASFMVFLTFISSVANNGDA
jgi:hypothetical protein